MALSAFRGILMSSHKKAVSVFEKKIRKNDCFGVSRFSIKCRPVAGGWAGGARAATRAICENFENTSEIYP